MTETIVALATPPGRGGVAIVRVSGPKALSIGQNLSNKTLKPRIAYFGKLKDQKKFIDEGVILFFKGPNSFTGEDIVEFQVHGGPFVVDKLIEAILGLNARLAEPGEFSKRAFLNDKIDLIQAEAIADLINANSEESARLASCSLQGEFSKEVNQLIEKLINLRVYVEAAIDFPDEEIDFISDGKVKTQLEALQKDLFSLLGRAKEGSLIREGMQIAIVGKPNVGKSTLLNCLARNDVAIVTDIAGTTRDLKKEAIDLDGLPTFFIDTAGLRQTDCPIEQEGIDRAVETVKQVDCILHLRSVLEKDDELSFFEADLLKTNIPTLNVINKVDLVEELPSTCSDTLYISAKDNFGITALKDAIKLAGGLSAEVGEGRILARRRHLNALNKASQILENGFYQLENHQAGELLALDLKAATDALSLITGGISADDVLGKIFSNFCIGK